MRTDRPLPIALAEAAEIESERGFTFVSDDGQHERFCSFAELADRAARLGAALVRAGLRRGDRLVLVLANNDEFVTAFFAALHVGVIPVPIYPPLGLGRLQFFVEQAQHVTRCARASAILTDGFTRTLLAAAFVRESRCRVLKLDALDTREPAAPLAPCREEDTCFIQFTSGSTAHPKGVMVSHQNVIANTHGFMEAGLASSSEDIGCSWLPLYHDMGLVGFVLGPTLTGISVVLLPPLLFLKRPREWLRRMTVHRATLSFAPNFAYGLCAGRLQDTDLEGLDLTHWRVAGCGAEPVQRETVRRFCTRFGAVGFDARAFLPVYGLAECTLAVTFSVRDRGAGFDRIELGPLTPAQRAEPVPIERPDALDVACLGRPLPGLEVRIVDAAGAPCAERAIGEVVVRGTSVTAGYFGDAATTAEVIRDGWLHTGDLGYLVAGELYVCGREKDVIIVAGRNYHAVDVEAVVSVLPGVRTGNVVAFGILGTEERVVVCAELRAGHSEIDVHDAIRTRVLEALGLRVDDVVLLPQGRLPKTSSGKLRRRFTRELYRSGELVAARRGRHAVAMVRQIARAQAARFRRYGSA